MSNRLIPTALVLAACALVSMSSASCDGTDDDGPDAGSNVLNPDAGRVIRPDAGTTTPPDAGTDPCAGGASFENCDGNTAQWCDTTEEELIELDCETLFQGIEGTCGVFDNWGSWCAYPEGGPCVYEDEQTFQPFPCGDSTGASATLACDYLSSTCVASTGTCTYSDTEDFVPACNGTALMVECFPWSQPLQIDCTDALVGGTACTDGKCVGIPVGKACDESFTCAEGLTCTNDVCTEPPAP